MALPAVNLALQQVRILLGESLDTVEAKFAYDFPKNKIQRLQETLESVKCLLEDADNRQQEDKLVGKYVAQITHFAYKADDLMERFFHEVPKCPDTGIWDSIKWFSNILCGFHVCKLHHLADYHINRLTITIDELTSRVARQGVRRSALTKNVAYNKRKEAPTYSRVEEEPVGLEKDVQQVVEKLTEPQVKVVSVIGTGGLGKSTLARKVFVDKAIKEHFNKNCAWVFVSKGFSRRHVFEEILSGLSSSGEDEGIGQNIEDLTDEELGKKIAELLEKKKCFVVLDDIETASAWNSLALALGSIFKSNSRSKVLLTTRNNELLKHIDSDGYPHPLQRLSPDNSWELLQRMVFPRRRRAGNEQAASFADTSKNVVTATSNTPSSTQNKMDEAHESQVDAADYAEMEKLGREMLEHCYGLPLAIIALGGILSTKRTIHEWKEVKDNISDNISKHLRTGIEHGIDGGGIRRVLELSYVDLPLHLKPCLLYLASFPENWEISRARLYRLWEMEGIIEIPKSGVEGSCFEMGERCLQELIETGMVQEGACSISGRIKTCRVHDLIRDLCIAKCNELSFLDVPEVITKRKQWRRCALHVKGGGIDEACSPEHGEKAMWIRHLLAFQLQESRRSYFGREKLLNMVKCFPLLRVLDLEDAQIDIEVLEVGYLIHLRYLSLRYARVKKVASCIGDLKYLVVLDLRSKVGSRTELPNKFHQMKRLRHLYLPLRYSVKDKGKLSFGALQIETLKNFDLEQCELKDLLQLTRLSNFSTTKHSYIDSEDQLEVLAETPLVKAERLVSSVRLQILMRVIDIEPTILRSVFKSNRCFIKLSLVRFGNDLGDYQNMVDAITKGAQVFPCNLTHLSIINWKLGEKVILELEKLPHLQVLQLLNVHTGNKITFSPYSFPRLNFLSLSVFQLKEWEVGDGALPNLQRLELASCKELKKLPDGLPHPLQIKYW